MSLAWYPWYCGDYSRDTADLSCCEHGCYRLLLDAFWATGPLDDDLDRLQRLAADAPAETVRFVLGRYWIRNDSGLWINERLEQIRIVHIAKHERRVTAGKRGGDKKASNALAMLEHCSTNQNQNHNQKKIQDIRATKRTNFRCPHQKIVDLYHEQLPELRKVHDITPTRQANIRARWKNELPDLDAWKEFFTAVRRSDFLMGRCAPTGGRNKPFQADIDWLIKPANVVKVAEGKYLDG